MIHRNGNSLFTLLNEDEAYLFVAFHCWECNPWLPARFKPGFACGQNPGLDEFSFGCRCTEKQLEKPVMRLKKIGNNEVKLIKFKSESIIAQMVDCSSGAGAGRVGAVLALKRGTKLKGQNYCVIVVIVLL
jgi:hypothetical protein